MSLRALCKRKLIRLAALVAVCFAALILTGCGASLTVYDYTENGRQYNVYELSVDNDTVRKMEDSATFDADGKKYTVSDYFYALFSSYGYALKSAEKTETAYVASYAKEIVGVPELYRLGTAVEFEYAHTENPFVRNIKASSPNPFNGVRRAYDDVLPEQSATIMQQLKNGRIAVDEYGERVVQFPSVTDAFPYLNGVDPSGLLLSYARRGSKRMSSSGARYENGSGQSTYVFSRYFDTTETTVELEYERPVPYGWYLVALAAGGITLAAIVIATRTKKNKPTLLDRFPYNPEEYRDYETHLPANK